MSNELRSDFKAVVADLKQVYDLPAVAEFVSDVYQLGLYAEPKDYNKIVKPYVKQIDSMIMEYAMSGADVPSNRVHTANLLFRLAEIRHQLTGHYWRAERIVERAKLYDSI